MTNFDRVKEYYSKFPEENRFKMMGFSGTMEYEMTMRIKAECWVAGVGFLLLAIFAILALVNKMWLQLGIFAIIFAAGAVILLL